MISYFPQLADGGSADQRWVTSLTFVNPHQALAAQCTVYFVNNNGTPLALDFGQGAVPNFNFSVPPQGTVQFTSTGASPTIVTGWAIAYSTLPLAGVVQFRASVGRVPKQAISALATTASQSFRSPATALTGVAIANPSSTSAVQFNLSALDGNGQTLATTSMVLPALGHQSFPFVTTIFPSLSSTFRGSILIGTSVPSETLVAWTLSGEAGVLSSYPPSGLAWPISQPERIWRAWWKLLGAAEQLYSIAGIKLGTAPTLVIDYSNGQINAYADGSRNQVRIFINLAELISDSESELGFVIGHELGHIIQYQTGKLQFAASNVEWDADESGMVLSLLAGYDPYAAAGALAKLYMASGAAGLVDQNFDNLLVLYGIDPHGSYNDRLALIFSEMQSLCAIPSIAPSCAQYKSRIHPHLPSIAPLADPPSPSAASQKGGAVHSPAS